jgi:two-component SAPR family response regulator
MPQMNGFEFLEELQKCPDKPCIIFTTGFAEYAIESIKATNYGT